MIPMLRPMLGPILSKKCGHEILRPYLQVYDLNCVMPRTLKLIGTSWHLIFKFKTLGSPPNFGNMMLCCSADDKTSFFGVDSIGANIITVIKGVQRLTKITEVDVFHNYIFLELAATGPDHLAIVMNNTLLDTWEHTAHEFEVSKLFGSTTGSINSEIDYLKAYNRKHDITNIHYSFDIGHGDKIPNINPLITANEDLQLTGTQDRNWRWFFHT